MVDGDTLVAAVRGRPIAIRLIGVDAPETRPRDQFPAKGASPTPDCFGQASSDALAKLTPPGAALKLAADARPRDPYGRHLFYAWTAHGTFVNAAQILGGNALTMIIPPNTRHAGLFLASEATARRARKGLWRTCTRPPPSRLLAPSRPRRWARVRLRPSTRSGAGND